MLVPILFLVSFGASFAFFLLVINELINLNNTLFFWIIVFLCVFLAGLVGYVAMILPKYGFFIIGAVFGVVCALILDELFLEKADSTNTLFRIIAILAGNHYNILIILGLGCGILSFVQWRKMVIVITTVTGAYLIV